MKIQPVILPEHKDLSFNPKEVFSAEELNYMNAYVHIARPDEYYFVNPQLALEQRKAEFQKLKISDDIENKRKVEYITKLLELNNCQEVYMDKEHYKTITPQPNSNHQSGPKESNSLLDVMVDGREFESLFNYQYKNVDFVKELRRCIAEIEKIRNHPVVCYIADILNGKAHSSIEHSDDLAFREMINNVPTKYKEIDVVLVTSGGDARQVNSFVSALRPRFEKVSFILLDKAMSAGTIFIMSGDEIIMSEQSVFGPIDPQTVSRNGRRVPAQSLLIALNDIKIRGEEKIKQGGQPDWTDLQLLRQIDPSEIGTAKISSQYSIDMVTNFLFNFKFKSWVQHAGGRVVTKDEKAQRARRVAALLCNHGHWKNHGYIINRAIAENLLQLKITHSENIQGLDRAMRRMWAVVFWIFESTPYAKFFLSRNYCITRRVG